MAHGALESNWLGLRCLCLFKTTRPPERVCIPFTASEVTAIHSAACPFCRIKSHFIINTRPRLNVKASRDTQHRRFTESESYHVRSTSAVHHRITKARLWLDVTTGAMTCMLRLTPIPNMSCTCSLDTWARENTRHRMG